MRCAWLPVAVGLVLLGSGCGGSQLDRDAKDPNVYARSIKKGVQELSKSYRENPKAIKTNAETFHEKLKAYPSHSVGDNKATYDTLLQKCEELISAARASNSAAIERKLEEMLTAANKLPD